MSIGRMRIIYHPVLKKMELKRKENGGWCPAGDKKSCLYKYISSPEGIILQDQGDDFFLAILKSMDNMEQVVLDFEGTAQDYEDLTQMVLYFNKNHETLTGQVLSVGELIELPSVKEIFSDIMDYSQQTMADFKNMKSEFECSDEVFEIYDKLDEWIKQLENKWSGLSKDEINLCLVGSYDSGKSTLINALIGESILPESIKSETAKMFKVDQIISDKPVTITFYLSTASERVLTTLQWNEDEQVFQFMSAPTENVIRASIQRTIFENKSKKRHEQLRMILACINNQPYTFTGCAEFSATIPNSSFIEGIVEVRYPFALESAIQFHIYDTPGSDSNNPEHLLALKKALEEPTSSILIYVNHPAKLEGTANSVLLRTLNQAKKEKGACATTIDLARSFFVINWADTLKDEEAFRVLQHGQILLKSELTDSTNLGNSNIESVINLDEKRLFFTDALHASDAQAKKRQIADQAQTERLEDNGKLVNRKWLHFFRYDVMAKSKVDTEQLCHTAEAALAEVDKYSPEAFYICSGVYSLQKEIEKYSDKFALAVRAKGIIDGTKELISNLDSKCEELRYILKTRIDNLKKQIEIARGAVLKDITKLCDVSEEYVMSDETAIALSLDRDSISSRKNSLKDKLASEIKGLQLFSNDQLIAAGRNGITTANFSLDDFLSHYKKRRKTKLLEMQGNLVSKVKNAIKAIKDLDDETKNFLVRIDEINIPELTDGIEQIALTDYLHSYIFGLINTFDKDNFIKNVIAEYEKILSKSSQDYKNEYTNTEKKQRLKVAYTFEKRIDEFAQDVADLEKNRIKVENELYQLDILLKKVQLREKQLTEKIYRRTL